MINKLVSSKAVIAKVIADLNLDESEIRISDVRQWIADAMEEIGAVQQYQQKIEKIPVIGYQAKLPCDLHRINQVAFSLDGCNGWLPMRKSTGSFGPTRWIDWDPCCKAEMFIQDNKIFPIVKALYNVNTDAEALKILNEEPNVKETIQTLINQYTFPTNNGRLQMGILNKYQPTLQYTTKPGWIVTNVPRGILKISYTAIYTDEDSMPLIPDNVDYFEAIFWYVAMKMMYPKVLSGEVNFSLYQDMRNSWRLYKKKAYGNAMMPDSRDDMQTIQNVWLKLYPEQNEHEMFFNETGDEQFIYNQNRP